MFSLKLRHRGKAGRALLDYAGSLPTFNELKPFFDREFRRARRYERPLSVLILSLEPPVAKAQTGFKLESAGESGSVQELVAAQLRFFHIGALLRDALRETDLAGYIADTQEFVVLLPEIDLAGAEQTVRRINALLMKRLSIGLHSGAAEFPAGGLTLGDLVDNARSGLSSQPVTFLRMSARG